MANRGQVKVIVDDVYKYKQIPLNEKFSFVDGCLYGLWFSGELEDIDYEYFKIYNHEKIESSNK